MLLQACLNGSRSPGEHPALPLDPAGLARDAATAVAAGARSLHVHPRDREGAEALDPVTVGSAVGAIRAAAPGTQVGVSTGLWITHGDHTARLAAIAAWRDELPDFASVNLSEPGWLEVVDELAERGVATEAGVWTAEEADALVSAGVAGFCVRVLVEPRDADGQAAVATAARIDAALDAGALTLSRLHHGTGPATWSVLDAAARRGRDIRIGLEDVLTLPGGEPAAGNAELVAAAAARYGTG